MKQFYITSTITIEAENEKELDKRLQKECTNVSQDYEIASDLLRNAEIDGEV